MQIPLLILLIITILYFLKKEREHKATEESFLSIVNHVFRTPLTRIKWQSESFDPSASRETQLETARNISDGINHVLSIIDTLSGIKDVQNQASYDLKAVSLREITEGSISRYRTLLNEKKISLTVPTFTDMPLLTLDTKKISFVIDALLSNAIWYSKENGNIKIDSIIKNNKLIISVSDNGIGLSWKDHRNLYRRFYRGDVATKMNTDGMGLSLHLAKEIIRRHHGSVEASSTGRDKGSVFSITLPLN